MEKLKVVSLFSGIGAYEKALRNLHIEHELLKYCELDKVKSKAYAVLNNVSEELNMVDVTALDLESIPAFDLLFASPPCQSYSQAGSRKGLDDIRGTLFYNALEVVQSHKPKYVVMENVANLPNKFTQEFTDMVTSLKQEGYNVYWDVINAKDFIPQNRNRVYIVAIREDVDKGTFTFTEGTNEDYWYDYIDVTDTRPLTPRQQRMVDVAKGLNTEDTIKLEGTVDFDCSVITLRQSGLRFQSNKEYPTITAYYGKGGGNFTIIAKDGNLGGITPRSCFKLMGFDYEDAELLMFHKFSQSAMYRMAGDSVCVPVLEMILNNLLIGKEVHTTNEV